MTTREIFMKYIGLKSEIKVIQDNINVYNTALYKAETDLLLLKDEISTLGEDALLQSLMTE